MTPETLAKGLAIAQRTAQALEAEYRRNGSQLALLARVGQDLSKYQLHYSHFGWAYRTSGGLWRVAHKLNECGTAQAHVYRQGLAEFFLDDMWRYEAGVQFPRPECVQQALRALITAPDQVLRLQQESYSMVSYAWGQRYQQSNQWALETLAAAMEPATIQRRDRARGWAWAEVQGYEPGVLTICALELCGFPG